MRIAFDTNVVLDVLLVREPFVLEAALLMEQVESGRICGILVATTITTLSYFLERAYGADNAKADILDLLRIFDIAAVGRAVLEGALEGDFRDFEDAVLLEAARSAAADGIVTRNPQDFSSASLAIYTPRELLHVLSK